METTITGTGTITKMEVKTEFSSSACTFGTSYGFENDKTAWVNKGCKALFVICMTGM